MRQGDVLLRDDVFPTDGVGPSDTMIADRATRDGHRGT